MYKGLPDLRSGKMSDNARSEFYNEQELSEAFGWSRHTLRQWRWLKKGPPYVKRGGIWYPKQGVRNWLLETEQVSA